MSLQYSRTHCGPSMPTGVVERRSVCQLPSVGGSGYPLSAAFSLRAVGVEARGDVLRHLDEMAGHDRPRSRDHVVVVLDARGVGDERPEVTLVGEQRVRARCDVRIELRLRRSELGRVLDGSVSGPLVNVSSPEKTTGFVVAGDRDVVLMVVPAHPVDGVMLPCLHVECDDHARLALGGIAGCRRPRLLLPVDVVGRFLVREEDLPRERFPRCREEVRAEALVSRRARDRERAVQHPRRVLVEPQPAHLCVIEVVLAVRRGRCGGDVRERHLARSRG